MVPASGRIERLFEQTRRDRVVSGRPGDPGQAAPARFFKAFKYTIYLLLSYNVLLWFRADLAASAATFGGDVSWLNVVEAYSATVDTAAWVALLLLFELETAVIPESRLGPGLRRWFSAARTLCYLLVVYSFWGYWVKYGVIRSATPVPLADPCNLAGEGWRYLRQLDDYPLLDSLTCLSLQGQELLRIAETKILATAGRLGDAVGLARVDILNAGTWLIVVVLLEAEVWLQARGRLTGSLRITVQSVKALLYGILLLCAAYWGLEGDFLDFWDAALWLTAFMFIELNVFRRPRAHTPAGTDGPLAGQAA